MSQSRQLSIILVMFCAALATACGGDDDTSDRPQPTTTTVSTTTTTTSPDAADEQALRQLAEDWNEISRSIYLDRSVPLSVIDDFIVDPYKSGFVSQVETYRSEGRSSRPGEASRQVVESVALNGDEATVTECIVNGEVLLDSTGGVIDDSVVSNRFETRAVRGDRGWRFSDRTQVGEEREGDTCPA